MSGAGTSPVLEAAADERCANEEDGHAAHHGGEHLRKELTSSCGHAFTAAAQAHSTPQAYLTHVMIY